MRMKLLRTMMRSSNSIQTKTKTREHASVSFSLCPEYLCCTSVLYLCHVPNGLKNWAMEVGKLGRLLHSRNLAYPIDFFKCRIKNVALLTHPWRPESKFHVPLCAWYNHTMWLLKTCRWLLKIGLSDQDGPYNFRRKAEHSIYSFSKLYLFQPPIIFYYFLLVSLNASCATFILLNSENFQNNPIELC